MCQIASAFVCVDGESVPRFVRVTLTSGEVVEFVLPLPGSVTGIYELFGRMVPLVASVGFTFDDRLPPSVSSNGSAS